MTAHPLNRLQRRKLKEVHEKKNKHKAGKVRKRLKASIEEKETEDVLQRAKHRTSDFDG